MSATQNFLTGPSRKVRLLLLPFRYQAGVKILVLCAEKLTEWPGQSILLVATYRLTGIYLASTEQSCLRLKIGHVWRSCWCCSGSQVPLAQLRP